MSDLTTTAKVKTHLGITSSADDALIGTLVTAASRIIEKYCDNAFNQATYTEYYDGNGEPDLLLAHGPIISVTSLNVDSGRTYADATLLTEGSDFVSYKDEARVEMLRGSGLAWAQEDAVFPNAQQAVKIVYVAGYATIPADLELAANEMAAYLYNNRGASMAVSSQSIGGFSESYSDEQAAAIPNNVKLMLAPYVNHAIEGQRMTT